MTKLNERTRDWKTIGEQSSKVLPSRRHSNTFFDNNQLIRLWLFDLNYQIMFVQSKSLCSINIRKLLSGVLLYSTWVKYDIKLHINREMPKNQIGKKLLQSSTRSTMRPNKKYFSQELEIVEYRFFSISSFLSLILCLNLAWFLDLNESRISLQEIKEF